MTDPLRSKVMSSLRWSVLQSWGVKALNLLLYLVLARLLNPTEFGIAGAVALVLLLQQMVAEFGFADALIQRKDIARRDITLPFAAGVGGAIALSLIVVLFAHQIERLINVPGLAPYLLSPACLRRWRPQPCFRKGCTSAIWISSRSRSGNLSP